MNILNLADVAKSPTGHTLEKSLGTCMLPAILNANSCKKIDMKLSPPPVGL